MKWICTLVKADAGRVSIDHWILFELPQRSGLYTMFRVDPDARISILTDCIRTMELRPEK
jgi:hypothetical protein